MMKKMKDAVLLLAVFLLSMMLFGVTAKAAEVEINPITFPDEGFRDYVLEEIDKNKDGVLSTAEIKQTDYLVYCGRSCKDLTGVEYLTYLETLYCSDNKLSSLDVSKLTKLVELDCSENNLKTLNVTKNTALEILSCYDNQLTKLNVSKNLKLRRLYCDKNELATLSVSANKALAKLSCCENELTTLDVTANTALGLLNCADNKLTKLDISRNKGLFGLYCDGNSLKSVNISGAECLVNAYVKAEADWIYQGVAHYSYDDYTKGDPDESEEEESDGGLYCVLEVDTTTKLLCKPKITSPKAITKKTVNAGDKVSLKVTAKSAVDVTYQWYYRKGTSGTWTKVTAASGKKATYTFTAADKHNGYQYMCRVKNTYGSANSKVFKLTVKPLPKITSPTTATTKTVSKGKAVTFKVTATGADKYQWYYRTSRTGSWKTVAAASGKTASYKLFHAAAKHNGYQYRCKVYNATGGYVYSKIFTLKVK